jgi:phosphopantothenoylcysteine decarboxylase/phosphopantothenate--cysteine ligase
MLVSNHSQNLGPVAGSEHGSRNILLLVSGSIAAFKAVALTSKLVQAGYEVEVVMSESAGEFVGAASFEGFTRKKVHLQNFESGTMMAHIDLERKTDLILNYPSTATTISKFVHGNGESLLGAIFLAHEFKKPFWVAPAMNQGMMANPALEENLAKLEHWGIRTMLGEAGNLACGEVGSGRLMEPETMLAHINQFFAEDSQQRSQLKRILITAGGTREPIDSVRSITNFSTGETGYRLAKHLQNLGHEVTLLQSKHSQFLGGLKNVLTYDTTRDFAKLFEQELKNCRFDTLIHSAAVADYAVDRITTADGQSVLMDSKIQSSGTLVLTLKPNPKLIQNARRMSLNPKLQIISFKLTSGDSDKKLESYDSEYILHNELSEVASHHHKGILYKRTIDGRYLEDAKVQNKSQLTKLIAKRVNS